MVGLTEAPRSLTAPWPAGLRIECPGALEPGAGTGARRSGGRAGSGAIYGRRSGGRERPSNWFV